MFDGLVGLNQYRSTTTPSRPSRRSDRPTDPSIDRSQPHACHTDQSINRLIDRSRFRFQTYLWLTTCSYSSSSTPAGRPGAFFWGMHSRCSREQRPQMGRSRSHLTCVGGVLVCRVVGSDQFIWSKCGVRDVHTFHFQTGPHDPTTGQRQAPNTHAHTHTRPPIDPIARSPCCSCRAGRCRRACAGSGRGPCCRSRPGGACWGAPARARAAGRGRRPGAAAGTCQGAAGGSRGGSRRGACRAAAGRGSCRGACGHRCHGASAAAAPRSQEAAGAGAAGRQGEAAGRSSSRRLGRPAWACDGVSCGVGGWGVDGMGAAVSGVVNRAGRRKRAKGHHTTTFKHGNKFGRSDQAAWRAAQPTGGTIAHDVGWLGVSGGWRAAAGRPADARKRWESPMAGSSVNKKPPSHTRFD